MPSHHQLTPQIALYCDEEHYCDTDSFTPNNNSTTFNYYNTPHFDDDDEIASLLHKEQEHQPLVKSRAVASPAAARADAVDWILKVVHYYSFSALTAVLAVNYFDRFQHSSESRVEKPWMAQLTAVACISLAAKVEETHVPLLFDLQVVEETDYVFESKTIQRMEILVLSTLDWKMNPVTPVSFLDCIARKLGLLSEIFLRRCHCLLLSLLTDCRFMKYPPSALATATMVYVISSVEPTIGVEHHDQLIGILGISKDKVESCCRLIEEVATGDGLFYSCNKRKLPGSPKGVVDVYFSSDDSSAVSSPEHLAKKFKSK
ncbi:cyclin-D3-1-like [Salvia divinorum]|uniref:Cyclin-D3-1-like n=1 Tax=Salvia divinorum TaxID=28513 RepID=A0ABD1I7T1_SALDI